MDGGGGEEEAGWVGEIVPKEDLQAVKMPARMYEWHVGMSLYG